MQETDIRPGDELYINDRMFIDHGEDDTCGGIAVVERVDQNFIYFREPAIGLNRFIVLSNQKQWAKEFGDRLAHACPDVPGHVCPNPRKISRETILAAMVEKK